MKGVRHPKMRIKTGDLVVAVSGEDAVAGKTGKVLHVFPANERAIVEGFNLIKKTLKKSQDNPQGGIVEKEAPIHLSNLHKAEGHEHKPDAAPAARRKKSSSKKEKDA